jgi:3-dehydroquinate dehydratase-1/3-dehydroquinate dehydratase/shikimate dehydrogenase
MTLNCAVIVAENAEQAKTFKASALAKGADALEFRLDAFSVIPDDFSFFAADVPTIATFRSESDEERKETFDRALAAGADYIDIEADSGLRDIFPKEHVICSYHNYDTTPPEDEILTIINDLKSSGIPKAAFRVRGPKDLIAINDAAVTLRREGQPFILIGMGEEGEVTRLRASDLGSLFNYCALTPKLASAPGQLTIDDAVWFGKNPVVTGITGYPLTHTFSPEIHNAAFKAAHIPGKYVKIPALPEELHLIPDVLLKYRITGINVTIPHKETIIPFLRKTDPLAKSAGAVNTILNTQNGFDGFNTDIMGISASLASVNANPKETDVLVIGAGGAARGAVAFLTREGAHVSIANRTRSRAEKLAQEFGARAVGITELQPGYTIIINATPAGMSGFENISPVPDRIFTKECVVMDMIYDPEMTPFLTAAKSAGVRAAVSGKTMLIEQAAAAFTIWTGIRPDRDVMKKTFEERSL